MNPTGSIRPDRPADSALRKIIRLAGGAVSRWRMIANGDRILVGVSGGKDSLILMRVLHALRRKAPVQFDILGVTVDMGFDGFDAKAVGAYCHAQGWAWESVEFPGAEILREKNAEARPCFLCSRLRRGHLHKAAHRLNCSKIALGQHRDDLCASFLMSLFRGGGVRTMAPNVAADSGRLRLIRPLCAVPESLIRDAAAGLELPKSTSCPFAERLRKTGDRAKAALLLQEAERLFPNAAAAMFQSMSDIRAGHLACDLPQDEDEDDSNST